MAQPLLQINDLSVDFVSENAVTKALKNINISVKRGELLAIVGESGSGKSVTSLSILQLLPTPPAVYTSGEILLTVNNTTINILGANVATLEQIRGNEISMIFQEPMTSLNPVLTCGFQVLEAVMRHTRISKKEAKEKTISLFEKVKLPDPPTVFSRYPHQLSGGQKQRVMIAMAMSCEPSLLICDEPTTALDVTVQKNILELIRELQVQNNMGVIFITHNLGVVAEIADTVAVMYKGAIVEYREAKQLFQSPQHPYTKALLACRPGLHEKGERLPVVADFMEENEAGEIVEKTGFLSKQSHAEIQKQNFVGTQNRQPDDQPAGFVSSQSPDHAYIQIPHFLKTQNLQASDTILSVSNLQVWFPGKKTFLGKVQSWTKAVDDVSFDVKEGETLGLVGESGCGKTTLGRTVLRLIEATSGSIQYKEEDIIHASAERMKWLRKEMQIIFQDPYSSLNPRITIGEAIAEPLYVHKLGGNARERKEKVMSLLEKVNLLPEHYHRYPHEFSGGQRQRIVIARALALNPSFVICDESVSALDVSVQAQVLNLLNDLKKEFGFTAIFISHDLSVVRYISDRIMVMNKGRVEEIGEAEQVYNHPQSEYTRRLIESIPAANGQ